MERYQGSRIQKLMVEVRVRMSLGWEVVSQKWGAQDKAQVRREDDQISFGHVMF